MLRLFLLSLALITAACTTSPEPAPVGEATMESSGEKVEQARQSLLPLKKGLQGALQEAMQEGPQQAIEVCRLEAPRLADEASTHAIQVGRTSHRVRNPTNEPEAWMEPYLEEFRGTSPQPEAYRATTLEDGTFAYVEPIYAQAMCVTCHGAQEDLAPSIQTTLDEQYPEDQATGFSEGDFRGLFWVTMD